MYLEVDFILVSSTGKKAFLALSGILAGGFIGLFSETALNIAIPTLMQQLHQTAGTIQWLITGYMLVIGIVLPLSNLISHWFATKKVLLFAVGDFAVGAIISALAPNFAWLLFGRMIQGIATGLLLPLMFTVAALIFPPEKLARILGIIGLVIMFAPALGPTISGVILQFLNWRWIFLLFLPILLAAAVLIKKYVPNVIKQTRPEFSWLALIASALGFGMLITAASLAGDLGFSSPIVIVLLAAAIIILVIYIKMQLKSKRPILNFRVFENHAFAISTALIAINFGVIIGSMYLLPLVFQRGLGASAGLTGWLMLPGGIVNALVSAISGRFYDQFGARRLAVFGLVIVLIGTSLFVLIEPTSAIGYLVTAHIILMIGVALVMSPVQAYGLSHLQRTLSGDGSTIMNTLQQITGSLVTALTTILLGWGESIQSSGNSQTSFIYAAHYGFVFILLLVITTLILAIFLREQDEGSSLNSN